jgi:tRNA-Thr(GGU) m(6)t(6)A37 methyltransferase TsaA
MTRHIWEFAPGKGGAMAFKVVPVGVVSSGREDPAETDHWGAVTSTIIIDDRFGDDCLLKLDEFSHVEVIFVFHLASERPGYPPHPPRGRPDLPQVGVFAGRGPRRPNRIGATICQILSATGHELQLSGLDAVAGTPVLDLKPVMAEFLPGQVRQPEWSTTLMSEYFQP